MLVLCPCTTRVSEWKSKVSKPEMRASNLFPLLSLGIFDEVSCLEIPGLLETKNPSWARSLESLAALSLSLSLV